MARISLKSFENAVKGTRGIITLIAQNLGKSRQGVYDFLEKYPKAKEILEEEAERPVDMAENILHKKLKEEDWNAVKTILLEHKRGRVRGYGYKQELEHTGQMNNKIEVIWNETKSNPVDEDSERK